MMVVEDISFINVLIVMKSGKLAMGAEVDCVPNVGNTIQINGRKISVEQCSMYHTDTSCLDALQQFGVSYCIGGIYGKL